MTNPRATSIGSSPSPTSPGRKLYRGSRKVIAGGGGGLTPKKPSKSRLWATGTTPRSSSSNNNIHNLKKAPQESSDHSDEDLPLNDASSSSDSSSEYFPPRIILPQHHQNERESTPRSSRFKKEVLVKKQPKSPGRPPQKSASFHKKVLAAAAASGVERMQRRSRSGTAETGSNHTRRSAGEASSNHTRRLSASEHYDIDSDPDDRKARRPQPPRTVVERVLKQRASRNSAGSLSGHNRNNNSNSNGSSSSHLTLRSTRSPSEDNDSDDSEVEPGVQKPSLRNSMPFGNGVSALVPFDFNNHDGDFIRVTIRKESEDHPGILFEKTAAGLLVLRAVPPYEKRVSPGTRVLAINGMAGIPSVAKAESLVSRTKTEAILVLDFPVPPAGGTDGHPALPAPTTAGRRRVVRRRGSIDSVGVSLADSERTARIGNRAPPGLRRPPQIAERPSKYQLADFDSESEDDDDEEEDSNAKFSPSLLRRSSA